MALQVTGSINVSGSISGSMSGSFQGDGSKLTGVGGTNPTTGSMPLNISGAFVDSPITATTETVPLTLSEFASLSLSQESGILNSGGTDSVIDITFNVGQATGLVDGMTYASYSTSFGGNTDVFTLTWTYIAESNPDRAFGVGISKLYAFGDGTTTSDRGTTISSAGLLIPPTAYSASLTSETTVTGNLTVSSNLLVTGSINVSDSISGSMSGSFQGDGSKLTGVGGTNPTTGSMPLNISGSFVDSPITVQQNAGLTPNANNGITYTEVYSGNDIYSNTGNICISDFYITTPPASPSFEANSLGLSGFEVIVVNDDGTVSSDIQNNYNGGNSIAFSFSSITTPFPLTYTDGDGDTLTVTISTAGENAGIVYMGGTGFNGYFQPSDFIAGNGSYNYGSGVTSPTTLAFGGVNTNLTTVTSPLTVTQNLSIGGTIGGAGESTITLTTSEINQITSANGAVNSLGDVTYINFNVANATNLVDNQTYSAVTFGSSLNFPSNDPSTYTREWVYLAEGNADLNLGLGNSILYTDNPNFIVIYDDTGNRSIDDYNSPAGLDQLDGVTAVGSGGALTTTGDIIVTGNITGKSNIILTGGDKVSLPTINYSQVGSGFESDILSTGGATTDVVYLTFNTGSGVGLEDGQTYSFLLFDDGLSQKTFTTDWIYIDENNSDRAFGVGESRLYAYESGNTYYDDSNSIQFTTLPAPSSYEVSPQSGNATIGNANIGGVISKNEAASAKYYIEDSGALPNAEGAFKFKIADNGDLGTTGYITFVRE
jgi:hypothetical protein